MRYASIEAEVVNGNDYGISLYVQGCHFHCQGCFNQKTWDFNGGEEWTENVKEGFFTHVNNSYVKRITILGGEPLADENLDDVLSLIEEIHKRFPDKKIWLYTGYTWNELVYPVVPPMFSLKEYECLKKRKNIVSLCDVLIDGRFEEDKKDLTLQFRGSSNQRLIDVQKTLNDNNKIVLWTDRGK